MMKTSHRPRARFKALGLLLGLACAGTAEAGSILAIEGYNTANSINFSYDSGAHFASYGGGSVTPAILNGQPLSFMYCVQFTVDVYVPGTYNTDVTRDGKINGTMLTNAAEVSWLVTNLAPTATTADQQSGLQAAIWYEVAGGGLGGFRIGNNTGQINADFLADLALLGITTPNTSDGSSATVAPISNLLYLTPFNADGSPAQGQVTLVPEPSTTVMAGTAVVVVAFCQWRRRRPKAA
jgi:hypothetical protein